MIVLVILITIILCNFNINSLDFALQFFTKFFSSAIITGLESSLWSVFDEQGNCKEVTVRDPTYGIARFYRNLREDLFDGYNIKRVQKGSYCK